MPGLNEVIAEMHTPTPAGEAVGADAVREKYIKLLAEYRKRNVICYYSGWLTTNGHPVPNLLIDDNDKNGFMNAVYEMDCKKGLDLVLHTPGGMITAAESLVYYLQKKFGTNIQVIVPQMAMSAGTMIACSASQIIMGHQSCIGPFDPQLASTSAFSVFDEFKRAAEQIKTEPHTIPLWQALLGRYPPAFLEQCDKAIELAKSIVPNWLRAGMLSDLDEAEREQKISLIMDNLNNPIATKEHSRHIHFDKAKELGLKVSLLEDDDQLQDLVLSLHHAYIATLMMTNTSKLIESQTGKRFILTYAK
ncbi:SDH family Clp fold serine proteinase [Shewanella algae]|uniref:SDH family Clp fold serine proteinase n=1 Tax=Shewanella algae TaxID=38313 RepID=UPI003B66B337